MQDLRQKQLGQLIDLTQTFTKQIVQCATLEDMKIHATNLCRQVLKTVHGQEHVEIRIEKQPQDVNQQVEEVKGEPDLMIDLAGHCKDFKQAVESSTASWEAEVQQISEDRAYQLSMLEKSGKRRAQMEPIAM